jgi:hypothetical protein
MLGDANKLMEEHHKKEDDKSAPVINQSSMQHSLPCPANFNVDGRMVVHQSAGCDRLLLAQPFQDGKEIFRKVGRCPKVLSDAGRMDMFRCCCKLFVD